MEAHKLEATNILDQVNDHHKFTLTPSDLLVQAQAEATLALVEQQRIANLIALETHSRELRGVEEETKIFTLDARANLIYHPEIKNALEID